MITVNAYNIRKIKALLYTYIQPNSFGYLQWTILITFFTEIQMQYSNSVHYNDRREWKLILLNN